MPSLEHVVEEEVAGDPLAHQAAVHVGKDRQHGVDLALLDRFAELGRVSRPVGVAWVTVAWLVEG